jgi:hypothetical protein
VVESDEPYATPLPVLTRNLYVETFSEPVIERVVSAAGPEAPIQAGSAIRISGRNLRGEPSTLLMGGVATLPTSATVTELLATLPPGLRAGVQGVQVQRVREMGTPPTDHVAVESNVAPFVLQPRIKLVHPPTNQIVEPDGRHSADVRVDVDPKVGRGQRVALILNESGAARAAAYTFVDEPRSADTTSIRVRAQGVEPASYLVRIQVDGAVSPLKLDGTDPEVTP